MLPIQMWKGPTGSWRSAVVLAAGLALASIAQAAGAQPAPSPDWAKIVAAAKKEGKVTVYSAQPPEALASIVNGFKKAYPDIAVETLRGPSSQVFPRVEQERASGLDGGDVWITTELVWLLDRAKEGKLLKPQGPGLNGWPSAFLMSDTVVLGGREPFVIPYNKTLVSNPPKNYVDLLKPEFKGKVGTSDLAATTVIAFYDWLEKTQDKDYLTKLKDQNPKFYVGGTPTSQAVASGEIAVGVFTQTTATKPLMEKGAPIDYVIPKPGLGVQYVIGAFGWSKRPNAALVMLDYIMSAEGQTAWHGAGLTASPRTGIPGSLDIASITAWDPLAYPANVAKDYTDRWNRIFK